MSVKRECTFGNTVLKSLWKVLVRPDRYIIVFDASIPCKLAGGVYVHQYKISLYIPIGFIEYQVRCYVPKFNTAWNEIHLSSFFHNKFRNISMTPLHLFRWHRFIYFDDTTSFISMAPLHLFRWHHFIYFDGTASFISMAPLHLFRLRHFIYFDGTTSFISMTPLHLFRWHRFIYFDDTTSFISMAPLHLFRWRRFVYFDGTASFISMTPLHLFRWHHFIYSAFRLEVWNKCGSSENF